MIHFLAKVLSITFMVIAINYLLRADGMVDYVMSGVLMLFGIYFSIKASVDKKENLVDACLDKTSFLVKNLLSLVTLISYGILVLSIFHLLKGDENSLAVLVVSLVATLAGVGSYWIICRKSKFMK